ncbi:hypothetical protein FOA52_012160, partial [Chlamydomonas sp. UWO 241]
TAREWAVGSLDFDKGTAKQRAIGFEVSIRVLGGLLSSFYLSGGDQGLLDKAIDLGERLLVLMETPSGAATFEGSLRRPVQQYGYGGTVFATAGTFSLEFTTLTRITGRTEFARGAYGFLHHIGELEQCDGLYCTGIRVAPHLSCAGGEMTLGGAQDSAYEYFLKQWVLSGRKDERMRRLYTRAIRGMRRHLVSEVNDVGGVLGAPPLWIMSAGTHTQTGPTKCNSQRDARLTARVTSEGVRAAELAAAAAGGTGGVDITGAASVAGRKGGAGFQQGKVELGAGSSNNEATAAAAAAAAASAERTRALLARAQRQGSLDADILAYEDSLVDVASGGEASPVSLRMDVEHLTCFVPGLLTLGHLWGVDTSGAGLPPTAAATQTASGRPVDAITHDDLMLAVRLLPGCYDLARRTPTGLAYDTGHWTAATCPEGQSETASQRCHTFQPSLVENRHRPEVIESMFYLWLATGHEVYRDWAWTMFSAFEATSRVDTGGYSTMQDAAEPRRGRGGRMEAFFMAETLKYLYLMFSGNASLTKLPMSQWVFNTEAHPLPVWGSEAESRALSALGITPTEFDPWELPLWQGDKEAEPRPLHARHLVEAEPRPWHARHPVKGTQAVPGID